MSSTVPMSGTQQCSACTRTIETDGRWGGWECALMRVRRGRVLEATRERFRLMWDCLPGKELIRTEE